jgi:hypothetical protein
MGDMPNSNAMFVSMLPCSKKLYQHAFLYFAAKRMMAATAFDKFGIKDSIAAILRIRQSCGARYNHCK